MVISVPDRGAEPNPQCTDCGSFMRYVDKYDEIVKLHDEAVEKGIDPVENGVPPGPWGYHECTRCTQ